MLFTFLLTIILMCFPCISAKGGHHHWGSAAHGVGEFVTDYLANSAAGARNEGQLQRPYGALLPRYAAPAKLPKTYRVLPDYGTGDNLQYNNDAYPSYQRGRALLAYGGPWVHQIGYKRPDGAIASRQLPMQYKELPTYGNADNLQYNNDAYPSSQESRRKKPKVLRISSYDGNELYNPYSRYSY